jgi:hypothetical protein
VQEETPREVEQLRARASFAESVMAGHSVVMDSQASPAASVASTKRKRGESFLRGRVARTNTDLAAVGRLFDWPWRRFDEQKGQDCHRLDEQEDELAYPDPRQRFGRRTGGHDDSQSTLFGRFEPKCVSAAHHPMRLTMLTTGDLSRLTQEGQGGSSHIVSPLRCRRPREEANQELGSYR